MASETADQTPTGGMCDVRPVILNGNYREVEQDRYMIGTEATYDCNYFYQFYSGHQARTLKCQSVGGQAEWVGERARCQLEIALVSFLIVAVVFLLLFLIMLALYIRLRFKVYKDHTQLDYMKRLSAQSNQYSTKPQSLLPSRSQLGIYADETTNYLSVDEIADFGSPMTSPPLRKFGDIAMLEDAGPTRNRSNSIPHNCHLGRMTLTTSSQSPVSTEPIYIFPNNDYQSKTESEHSGAVAGDTNNEVRKSEHIYEEADSEGSPDSSEENGRITPHKMRSKRTKTKNSIHRNSTRYQNYFNDSEHTRERPRARTPESVTETENEYDNNIPAGLDMNNGTLSTTM